MMLDVVLLLLFFKMRNLRPVVAKQLSPGHTAVGGRPRIHTQEGQLLSPGSLLSYG